MANKDVTFIRRNGRVIPIRTKTGGKKTPIRTKTGGKKKEKTSLATKKGLAFIASGIGVSALANFGAGKLLKLGAKVGSESIRMTKTAKFSFGFPEHTSTFGSKVGTILMGGSARRAGKTRKALKFSQGLRIGGIILSSALVGEGIAELARGQKGKQLSIPQDIGAQIAGYSAIAAGSAAFKKGATSALVKKLLSKGKL